MASKRFPWYLRGAFRFFGHEMTTQQHQEQWDTIFVTMALKGGELRREKARRLQSDEWDKVCSDVLKIKYEDQQEYVKESIQKQIVSMFTALHNILGYGEDKGELALPCKPPRSEEENEKILGLLPRTHGFALEIKDSTIPGAGKGVFVRTGSSVPAGTVIGLYPGEVHLYEYVMNNSYRNALFPDDDLFLFARYDNTYIDGRTAYSMPFNPYALAHMVNHPPPSTKPQVLQIAFDFPTDPLRISKDHFPNHLRRYIPNVYAKKPTWYGTWDRSACMRTVVLVNSGELFNGDELFVDYRLSPRSKRPSWYVPVDEKAAEMRWAPDGENEYDYIGAALENDKWEREQEEERKRKNQEAGAESR